MKKIILLFFSLFLIGCSKSNVEHVIVNTEVKPGGQFVQSISFECEDTSNINKEDFIFEGKAKGWMERKSHSFQEDIDDIQVEGNKVTLFFDEFSEKYFYITKWNIKSKDITVNSDSVEKVITPLADEFDTYNDPFTYHLYIPESTSSLPIVIVFHGYGDTNNLLAYRTSVGWVESNYPCVVLSPVIEDRVYTKEKGRDEIYSYIYEIVDELIKDGTVDASRIYVVGNSFGGMATLEFIEKYPEFVCAGIPLCSAIEYSDIAYDQLGKLKDMPLWIAQAENDQTISSESSKKIYQKLLDLNNPYAKLKIYSDEEMNEVGGSSDPNSTYSYHHVELAVMEDDTYKEWLFSNHK